MISTQQGENDPFWPQRAFTQICQIPEKACDYCRLGVTTYMNLHGCDEGYYCDLHAAALMQDFTNRLIASGYVVCLHCQRPFGSLEFFVQMRCI